MRYAGCERSGSGSGFLGKVMTYNRLVCITYGPVRRSGANAIVASVLLPLWIKPFGSFFGCTARIGCT